MCAYVNFISTTRNPGLYTKLLVCPIFGLLVLLFIEKLERMSLLSWEEGKIMEDLLSLFPSLREKFSSHTPVLPSLFVALLRVNVSFL